MLVSSIRQQSSSVISGRKSRRRSRHSRESGQLSRGERPHACPTALVRQHHRLPGIGPGVSFAASGRSRRRHRTSPSNMSVSLSRRARPALVAATTGYDSQPGPRPVRGTNLFFQDLDDQELSREEGGHASSGTFAWNPLRALRGGTPPSRMEPRGFLRHRSSPTRMDDPEPSYPCAVRRVWQSTYVQQCDVQSVPLRRPCCRRRGRTRSPWPRRPQTRSLSGLGVIAVLRAHGSSRPTPSS